jgi:hypothetical protein
MATLEQTRLKTDGDYQLLSHRVKHVEKHVSKTSKTELRAASATRGKRETQGREHNARSKENSILSKRNSSVSSKRHEENQIDAGKGKDSCSKSALGRKIIELKSKTQLVREDTDKIRQEVRRKIE